MRELAKFRGMTIVTAFAATFLMSFKLCLALLVACYIDDQQKVLVRDVNFARTYE